MIVHTFYGDEEMEGRPGVIWTATYGENTFKIHLIF